MDGLFFYVKWICLYRNNYSRFNLTYFLRKLRKKEGPCIND